MVSAPQASARSLAFVMCCVAFSLLVLVNNCRGLTGAGMLRFQLLVTAYQ